MLLFLNLIHLMGGGREEQPRIFERKCLNTEFAKVQYWGVEIPSLSICLLSANSFSGFRWDSVFNALLSFILVFSLHMHAVYSSSKFLWIL